MACACRTSGLQPCDAQAFAGAGGFLVHLVENLRGDLEGAEGCRHAGIDRRMHQDFLHFIARNPGVAGGAEVQLQLVELAHADQHRDGDHAARLVIEAGARPDLAPGILHQEVLEFRVERRAVLGAARRVRLPQHLLADFLAALKAILAHATSPVMSLI